MLLDAFSDIAAVNRDILTVWCRLARRGAAQASGFIDAPASATIAIANSVSVERFGSSTLVLFRPNGSLRALRNAEARECDKEIAIGEEAEAALHARMQFLLLWRDFATKAPALAAVHFVASVLESETIAGLALTEIQHLALSNSLCFSPIQLLTENLTHPVPSTERVRLVVCRKGVQAEQPRTNDAGAGE